MKPIRNILILCGVIALLAGGFYLVQQYDPEETETAPTQAPSISVLNLETDQIASVSVTHPEGNYTLTKQGGTWVVAEDADVRVSQSRVSVLLNEYASVSAQELIGENVQDVSPYGLEAPQRLVRIEEADGTATTLFIGHTALEGSVCYFSFDDKTKIYTKTASSCDSLVPPLSGLMDTAVYSIDSEAIGGISLSRSGSETVVLHRVNTASGGETPRYQWHMKAPLDKKGNEYGMEEQLLPAILSLSSVKVIPMPRENEDYGFRAPQATYSLWSLDKTEEYTVIVGKAEGANTYVKLEGAPSIYQVATEKLSFLSLSYLDLVDKLVHVENIQDVRDIHINGLQKQYHLTVSGEEGSAVYTINEKTIEESKFQKAYQTVIGLTLDGYTDSGRGAAVLTIQYTKRDGTKNVVTCHEYNDRSYLVQVNGSGHYLVRKKQVETMFSQLDKTLAES